MKRLEGNVKVNFSLRKVLLKSNKDMMFNSTLINILIKQLLKVVAKENYISKDKYGYYTIELYLDYGHKLEDDSITNILNKNNPLEYLNDYLYDAYEENINEEYFAIIEKITERLEELEIDVDEDIVKDYCFETITVENFTSHFLNQQVCANLVLDTGDGNFDFSCNDFLSYNNLEDYDEEVYNSSSLIWLAKQQGYTLEQFMLAFKEEDYGNSKFLKSIYEECLNTTTSMNAVTFLIDTTLGELIEFKERQKEIKEVIIPKHTNCGLVDFWQGAGGILEIALDKDVVIPAAFIDSFTAEGNRGSYGVNEIYGMGQDAWNGDVKVILKDQV